MKRSSERVRGEAAGAAIQPGGLLIGASIDPGTDEQEATGRGLRHVRVTAEPSGQALEPIMDRIEAGRLEVTLEHTYPLSAAAAAHRAIEERRGAPRASWFWCRETAGATGRRLTLREKGRPVFAGRPFVVVAEAGVTASR
ncbi:zinc-binding dehydrogenase [Streptomyces canus]|uniref:zinc-binding dehydrogenase n=1 Tax=Streptomyces canus TaxID=58343 RepID=UPI002251A7A5|nr:zinc-binding dehydrogenase [Streptomyces canus]MCX4859375.1 zinc-binding dehydrogenase [Streptomyces canus]